MKMYTYLNFGGNCAEAFRFYEQHLGGKVVAMMKWSQMPDAEKHTPPGYADAVLHGRMELGGAILMASDVPQDPSSPCAACISPWAWTRTRRRSESITCSPRAGKFT